MTEEGIEQTNEPQNVESQAEKIAIETTSEKEIEAKSVQSLTQEEVSGTDEARANEGDNENGTAEGEQETAEGEEDITDIIEEDEELDGEELEALFNKNTASFRCLAQILLSRSSLLRHPLYNFPPLQDPGIDAAFNYVEPEEPIDNICIEKYKKLCKEMNIVPLSRVIKSLPTKQLNLRYYSLSTKELKAVAKSLKLNTFVEELNLEENFLYPEAVYYIEELLRENNTLKVLNMKECRIGPEGAEKLSEGIMLTQSLNELDLSYNDLGTTGIKELVSAFKENGTIKKLNLSHNNLGLDAAYHIASILRENLILEDLDLSWNNFGTPPAMKVLFNEGISVNGLLRSLNLAWNGITLKTAIKPLTKFIKNSQMLEILDLNNNRIGGVTLNMIKNAIKKSASIRGLNLAYNVLTPDNAQAIADVLNSAKDAPNFQLLDMENVFVKKDFVPTLRKATRLDKTIKITGILGNWKIKGPNVPKLLFDRAQLLAMKPKRKKKRKDFSHFILTLPDKPMKKSAFETAVKKFKMKLVDNDLMAEIIKLFPYKKKGIDCIAMKAKYMELYPNAQPPPPKKKKGRHKKKDGSIRDSTSNLRSSQFTTSTVGETTIFSTVSSDKNKLSISEATHSDTIIDSTMSSVVESELSKPPRLSFHQPEDQSNSPPEDKRLSIPESKDGKRSSNNTSSIGKKLLISFNTDEDRQSRDQSEMYQQEHQNGDLDTENITDRLQVVTDSREILPKRISLQGIECPDGNHDSTTNASSCGFSVKIDEDVTQYSSEALPTITETLEVVENY